MRQESTLKRNALWNISGSAAYAAAQWATMIVLAKLAGAAEVGQFAFGLALTAPLFMLTNLQLRAIQLTDVGDEVGFGEYLGVRLATVFFSLLLVASYVVYINSETAYIVLAVGLGKALEAISEVAHGLFQRHERSHLVAKSLIAKAVCSVSTIGFSYYLYQNLLYATLSMATSWLFVLILFDLRFASELVSIKPIFNFKRLRSVLYRALPLGISMMFISLQTNVIRYFLEHYISSASLGVFSALTYLLMVGSILINSISQAASPRLAKYWLENALKSYKQTILILLMIAFVGGLISVAGAHFFGTELLVLIYSDEFASSKNILVILMLGGLLSYLASVLGYALTAAKVIKIQPYLFFVIFLIATGCAAFLVPKWGALGAAWTTVLVSGAQFIGSFSLVIYAIRRR